MLESEAALTRRSRTGLTSPGRLVSWSLPAAVVLYVGFECHKLIVDYREFRALKARLPDLAELRTITPSGHDGFLAKVWVHRVNSIERALMMTKRYQGLELDVVYDSAGDFFDVNHPPARSQGLSLDALLSSLPDVTEHYFWIDFKNLTESNEHAACRRLTAIARKHRVVRKVVVETTHPRALSCFTANGFYTSFYLPPADLTEMSSEQLAEYYRDVAARLKGAVVNAISSDYRSLPFMQRYFPGADILVWYLAGKSPRSYVVLAYLKSQAQVKIILVSEPGPGYR